MVIKMAFKKYNNKLYQYFKLQDLAVRIAIITILVL